MSNSDDDRGPRYEVGYGKPPEATRFKKGHSGNPKGKVPGRKNLRTELLEELGTRVTVTEGGKQRLLSKQSIILKRMIADAAKGDARAREQTLKLIVGIDSVQPDTVSDPVGEAKDTEILKRFKADIEMAIRKKKA